MLKASDVAPASWERFGPLAICQTPTEVFLAVHRLTGVAGVEQLLRDQVTLETRETLRQVADELRLVGMVDLASLIRSYARKAKRAPMTFRRRWAGKFAPLP
jgi:hypothetical protein